MPEAREVRHVQTERSPESNHRRQRGNKDLPELAERVKFAFLGQQVTKSMRFPNRPREQKRSHDEHEGRGPVLDSSQQIHPAINDVDIESPKEQKRNPLRRHVATDRSAEKRMPIGNDGGEKRVQRFTANPRLNAEPA